MDGVRSIGLESVIVFLFLVKVVRLIVALLSVWFSPSLVISFCLQDEVVHTTQDAESGECVLYLRIWGPIRARDFLVM